MNPLLDYEVVRKGSDKEPAVHCRKCGQKVVGEQAMATVRHDAGKLKALPFSCLAHRCAK